MTTRKPQELDYFEDISHEEMSGWQKYLQCQTKLFAAKEIELLQRLSFGRDACTVLDLGCGTGTFTLELHKAFPGVTLLASDTNAEFLNLFRQSIAQMASCSIQVCAWTVGSGACPALIEETPPRDVLMRLVLQHVSDPVRFLSSLKSALRPGTRLFIIEEDDGLYLSQPKCEAVERVLSLYGRWGAAVGSSRTTGRQLPQLAAAAGLHVRSLDILCHTSTNLGLQNLLEYYRISVEDMPDPAYTAEEARDISRSLADYAERYGNEAFFYYPQVFCVVEVPERP